VVKISDMGGTPVFTAIGRIYEGPDGPEASPDIQEAKTHDTDYTIRKSKGVTFGPLSFGILFDGDDEQHAQLLSASHNPDEPIDFQYLKNDTGKTKFTFKAFVKTSPAAPVDGFNTLKVELIISSDITLGVWT
jgi:hypothetical protein